MEYAFKEFILLLMHDYFVDFFFETHYKNLLELCVASVNCHFACNEKLFQFVLFYITHISIKNCNDFGFNMISISFVKNAAYLRITYIESSWPLHFLPLKNVSSLSIEDWRVLFNSYFYFYRSVGLTSWSRVRFFPSNWDIHPVSVIWCLELKKSK